MNCSEYLDVYSAGHLAGYLICTVNYRLTLWEISSYVCAIVAQHRFGVSPVLQGFTYVLNQTTPNRTLAVVNTATCWCELDWPARRRETRDSAEFFGTE